MRSIVRTAIAALIAIATVAGCGTGATSNAPAASSSDAASSPAASSSARASAKPSPSTSLVVPHDDPALEATLPDEAEGVKLFKLSVWLVSSI